MEMSWFTKSVDAVKRAASVGPRRILSIKIAVDKGTPENDCPPEEEHVVALLSATKERDEYPIIMNSVRMRLNNTTDWRVALKTLEIVHRLVQEGLHPSLDSQYWYHKDALNTMSQFEDRSNPLARECVLWVRTYSCYLIQRLQCLRLVYMHGKKVQDQNTQKIEDLEIEKHLECLPSLQKLVGFLLDCTPQGSQAALNSVIQYALHLLVKDCPIVSAAINSSTEKLVHSFFSLPREKALKVLHLYKQNIQQFEGLSHFSNTCRAILSSAPTDFPSLSMKPSESLLAEMEEHIGESSKTAVEEDKADNGSSSWDWDVTWD